WSRWAWAAAGSSNTHARPVGTPARSITSLANAFDASRRAAARLGPNTGIPSLATASARPAARGASGPITTRSTACTRANAATAPTSLGSTPSTMGPRSARPGLPGRDMSSLTRSLRASFQPRACSRPPDPTSRTLIAHTSVDLDHLGPLRPHRHPSDRHPDPLRDVLDVGACFRREVAEAASPADVRLPAGQLFVYRLALVEDPLLAGELGEYLPLVPVGDRHLDGVERREDVELGQEEPGERVDARRITQRHQVQPATTSPPTCDRPVLPAQLDHLVADLVVELGGERPGSHPGDVRLRHADDLVHCLGADARSDQCPAGRGVGGGHERICAVVDVEQGALGSLEQHLLALLQPLPEQEGGVGDV